MNVKPLLIANTVLIAAMLGLSLWVWSTIADDARLPVHWGLDGTPDGFGSKGEALLAMPILSAVISLIFLVLPYFDPRRKNLEQSAKLWNAAAIGVVALMALLHGFLVLSATGQDMDIRPFLVAGNAMLFIVLGNYLGKSRPNWFAGVRTPWTLSSDYSWEKTHRWAGRLFVLSGLAMLAALFLISAETALYVMIVAVIGTSLISIVLSYIFWRNDPERAGANGDA